MTRKDRAKLGYRDGAAPRAWTIDATAAGLVRARVSCILRIGRRKWEDISRSVDNRSDSRK